jgi:hypothetical protein
MKYYALQIINVTRNLGANDICKNKNVNNSELK